MGSRALCLWVIRGPARGLCLCVYWTLLLLLLLYDRTCGMTRELEYRRTRNLALHGVTMVKMTLAGVVGLSMLFFLALALFVVVVDAKIAQDGQCLLYTFVPFTKNGQGAVSLLGDAGLPNPGFMHMAAAMLAIDHFNNRNSSLVPELANMTECSVKINDSGFYDSGPKASRTLFQAGPPPCAVAGPFNDVPAMDLSAMATAAEFPLVGHRLHRLHVLSQQFASQTNPDSIALTRFLIEFLVHYGRNDFISLLYRKSENGIMLKEVLTDKLEELGITWDDFSLSQETVDLDGSEVDDTIASLTRMKERGFRTIVTVFDDAATDVPLLANAAEAVGMNNGDYFWVWFGPSDGSVFGLDNANVTKLLSGSAFLMASEAPGIGNYPLFDVIKTLGDDFVDRLNAANPISEGQPGYFVAGPGFFQNLSYLEYGSGFMYDAIMAIGLGACLAETKSLSPGEDPRSGLSHLDGVRKVSFSGATGRVGFRGTGEYPGARADGTSSFGIYNFYVPEGAEFSIGSSFRFTGTWSMSEGVKELMPFTFADGRTEPPVLLRSTPVQNYLSPGLRVLGFVLLGTVLVSSLLAGIWIFLNRKHRVLRAAQPEFLYMVVFGSAVFACAIIPISFDESYGWTPEQLSAACMSVPWLVCLGHELVYIALVCKLWRVHEVLQFRRRRIEVRHVVLPGAVLILGSLLVLALWTGLDSLQWVRVEIDSYTGESVGYCQSQDTAAFAATLAVLILIPTILTGVMAWKTKDVDDAYTESWWIFMLMLLQVELFIIGAPVIAILRTISVNGKYIGFVILLSSFPMSTLLLIMLPKVLAYRKVAEEKAAKLKRGERASVKVSGMEPPSGVLSSRDGGWSDQFLVASDERQDSGISSAEEVKEKD